MEDNYKMCPDCACTVFRTLIELPAEVKIKADDSLEIMKTIVDKASLSKPLLHCAKCGHNYKLEELKCCVVCNECGKLVPADELDENGLCLICHAKKDQPDIFNMSQEDLIRMLLKTQKAKAETMQSMKAITEKANASVQPQEQTEELDKEMHADPDCGSESATAETASAPIEQTEEKPKTTTRRKKTVKQPSEEAQAEEQPAIQPSPEPMEQAVNDMLAEQPVQADGENAPFPAGVEDILASVIEPPVQTGNEDSNSGDKIGDFSMFDNSNDRF